MRLSTNEVTAIKNTIHQFDSDARIILFGSRADDKKRGGDIDLLILSNTLKHRHKRLIRLKLYEQLGEQKIDLLISADTREPLVRIALTEGVAL